MLRGVSDQLRIGTNTPNQRVPPARLDFQKNWGARVIRNSLLNTTLLKSKRLA